MRIWVHRGIKHGLAALVLLTVTAIAVTQTGRGLLAEDASPSVTKQDRDFWSFRRVERPRVPAVRHVDRARTSIDRFLLERLEAKDLSFSPDADKRTLIRRVSSISPACRRRRRTCSAFSPTIRRTPTSGLSTGCWPRPTSASAGRATGSMWSDTSTPSASTSTPTSSSPARGNGTTAIT